MPITPLDLIVLGVVLISALLAMVRGFTREVLSIASWAAAAAATLYFLPAGRELAHAYIKLEPKILGDVIAGAAIFLVTLLIVSLITMKLSDVILDSRIGPFDRALGFVYGGARGLLLAIIAFLFFAWLVPERSQPQWVADAASKPVLESAGKSLLAMLPEDPEATILNRLKGGLPGQNTEPNAVPDSDPASPPAEPEQAPAQPTPPQN